MWSVIARYTTIGEAEMARSALGAAGIPSRVGDENTIAIDWLYSNAIGGVKVLVDDADRETAVEVLSSFAGAAAEGDVVAEPEEVMEIPAAPEQCPACGSRDFKRVPRLKIFAALAVIAYGFGIAVNEPGLAVTAIAAVALAVAGTPSHQCASCAERWNGADPAEESVEAPPPDVRDTIEPRCPRCGSAELYRVNYRRLLSIPLLAVVTVIVIAPLWLVLPKYKCDACGRRAWLPA